MEQSVKRKRYREVTVCMVAATVMTMIVIWFVGFAHGRANPDPVLLSGRVIEKIHHSVRQETVYGRTTTKDGRTISETWTETRGERWEIVVQNERVVESWYVGKDWWNRIEVGQTVQRKERQ